MDIREEILQALTEHRTHGISGQVIADRLGVSRAAVHKAVRALRERGYPIAAKRGGGYCLHQDADLLTARGIGEKLTSGLFRVEVVRTASSTNALLIERAKSGEREGAVLCAEEQTAGRGRMGRDFFSPRGTGLYLSILLRPAAARDASLLTALCAVAVCEAAEALCGRQAQIKWVNDIFLDGKKCCGILTQGALCLETGAFEYAVVGIGVNVAIPAGGFPAGMAASALFETAPPGARETLCAEILNRVEGYYRRFEARDFVAPYQARSLLPGKAVTVFCGGTPRGAKALAVDEDCRLVVEYEDGARERLVAGEVSVRL